MIPFHPLAEIFPLIEGEDFDKLVEDIRANGIREPIVLHEGSILDGRNRYRALLALRDGGQHRGPGWGVYENELLTDEDLDGSAGLSWFERFSPMLDGDPLNYVVSKNLMRRHLSTSQRGMLAADLGKLGWGGDRSKTAKAVLTRDERANIAKVSSDTVERADAIKEQGVPELQEAVRRGDIAVTPAAEIARQEPQQQRAELEQRGILPNGARAIMSSRQEPDDSLDYFPTPPWATRALAQHVLPAAGFPSNMFGRSWEPACGEGHIAEVLAEYSENVIASDVFDYGYGAVEDFLRIDIEPPDVDWLITNPPFGENALHFVRRALSMLDHRKIKIGVAMFFRSQWAVEGIERYEEIFRDRPPTLHAYFVERVNLCKGRWEPEGTTATAYCWLVWLHRQAPRAPFYIPPGCRDTCSRPDDIARFTAHPVIKRPIPTDAAGIPIHHDADGVIINDPPPADDDNLDIPAFLRRQPRPEATP